MTAKTVTNDDIAFVNENGVMFIKTQGVKFPCGYSKAEADAKFVTSTYTDGRYLKLTGGTLSGDLYIAASGAYSTYWTIDFTTLADDTISYSDSSVITYGDYTSNRVSISGVQKQMYAPKDWLVKNGRLVTYSSGSRPVFITRDRDEVYIQKEDQLVIVGSCAAQSGVVDREKTPSSYIQSITTTVNDGVYTETIIFSQTHLNSAQPIFLYRHSYIQKIYYKAKRYSNQLRFMSPHGYSYMRLHEDNNMTHLELTADKFWTSKINATEIVNRNSSNSYFLLGGGGTIARSNYLTSDVSYLPLTGGTLTGDVTFNNAGMVLSHDDGAATLDMELTTGMNITPGGLSITTDAGIDGGFSGYYSAGDESSNNNIPVLSFNIDRQGYNILNRQGSGTSAKNVAEATYDQYGAIVGKTVDPSDSSEVLTDFGFGFFAEEPSSDSFVGLTPTGVKLYGGSSSKILVSDGTMNTLKTINGESLLGSGDVAHVFYFDTYDALTTPTISTGIPATATSVSVGGVHFFSKINKFLALVTYSYSSTGYRQWFNIKDGRVVDSLGTTIASVPTLDSEYPRNSYGKAPDIYICTGTSVAYFGTGSGSTATGLTKLYGSLASKNSLSFGELTNKPTTLSGYGITDAVSTNGGTINGELTINSPVGTGIIFGNSGTITAETDGLYISAATSSGNPYVTIGSDCQIDVDGWIYTPAVTIGNESNGAQLYFYDDSGAKYLFNVDKAKQLGLMTAI